MIYYPLSTLMLAGIRDILVISTPRTRRASSSCSATASKWGIDISYAVQPAPEGIAQAFIIGAAFICGQTLGADSRRQYFLRPRPGSQFARRRGAIDRGHGVRLSGAGSRALRRRRVRSIAQGALHRGEAEAAEVALRRDRPVFLRPAGGRHRALAQAIGARRAGNHRLEPPLSGTGPAERRGHGPRLAWLDTGTHESLLEAVHFIQIIEKRQGLKIACVEEIAYRLGYIDAAQLERLAAPMRNNGYGQYLRRIIEEERLTQR